MHRWFSKTNPLFCYYDEEGGCIGEFFNGEPGEAEAEEKAFSLRVNRPYDFNVFIKKRKKFLFWEWTTWKHCYRTEMWWCDTMPRKEGLVE